MKYKKFTSEMKKKIVAEAMQAKSFKSVSIKYGVARSTLGGWLSDDELDPETEHARTRREKNDNASRGSRVSIKKPNDPIPEGIVMAAKTNPEELARENRDLRKKVDYLEDKVAYLEQLYKIIKTKPEEVVKKKDLKP